jgi:hypothetical protein
MSASEAKIKGSCRSHQRRHVEGVFENGPLARGSTGASEVAIQDMLKISSAAVLVAANEDYVIMGAPHLILPSDGKVLPREWYIDWSLTPIERYKIGE